MVLCEGIQGFNPLSLQSRDIAFVNMITGIRPFSTIASHPQSAQCVTDFMEYRDVRASVRRHEELHSLGTLCAACTWRGSGQNYSQGVLVLDPKGGTRLCEDSVYNKIHALRLAELVHLFV